MLKELRIQNIVLIESATIPFEEGFNVLSGETGSGKSALMETLSLISGERADSALIRAGAEKGSVEAVFDIDKLASVKALLTEMGIEWEEDEPLILRREIARSGKGRTFVNHQSAQIALLRQVSHLLFESVGQHANHRLLSVQEHRNLLTLYGGLTELVAGFGASWEEENRVKKALEEQINGAAQRARESEVCQREIAELKGAALRDGEEEELFAEYTRLSHAEELAGHIQQLVQLLTEGVVPLLNRQRATMEKVAHIDKALSEANSSYQNALAELQEVSYTLQKSNCESQPERIAELNERLTELNLLKRKYGACVADMLAYLSQAEAKLNHLENSDSAIEARKANLEALQQKNSAYAKELTEKRHKAARQLVKELTPHLRALNMPKAEFEVEITPQARNGSGDDHVEFFLRPNVGEGRLAVKDFASGGELSRLMLALQTLLAGKQQLPTLVFDEIDANIGGTTAAAVGEKLRQIGTAHQVIAITHFPQVAQHAQHHLQIAKRERQGRTLTEILPLLDATLREQELARMRGLT